jgi:SAM-dependent methyltransferase
MDFVIAANIIHRFSKPSPLVDELLRVVRKDGYVYLVVPSRPIFERERNGSLMSELLRDHDDTGDWALFNETRGSNHVTNDFLFACLYRNWKVYALLESDNYLKSAFTVVLQME